MRPTRIPKLAMGFLALCLLCGCSKQSSDVVSPANRAPVIDRLVAIPDTIGPSDSTRVVCNATDPDGDSLVYGWETDTRLLIQGMPAWNKYLDDTRSDWHTFYNANLAHPIDDSAWVYVEVHDSRGGSTGREVFIILRSR